MEIVMNDTDLIIGAELLEDNIQMCVYDSELKAPVAADTEKELIYMTLLCLRADLI